MTRVAVRLTVGLLMFSLTGGVSANEQDVRAALDGFLEAFENGDLDTMAAAFADDAVTFPRAIMSAGLDADIDAADYRRVSGIDPQMRALIEGLRAEGREPPFLSLEPRDLRIQLYGDAAVATFHLGDARLGRRTFVLARFDDEWKIVHLHASNVYSSK